MTKNKVEKKKGQSSVSFQQVNPDAAGIDVSASSHVVAVPLGRDKVNVKEFGAFTEDLQDIVKWLKSCNIDTVAMESTGVYWRQLFLVLVEAGFEVLLVNAKHVKNVSGRKTDESDAMWIQKLHSCGLLRSSFLPDEQIQKLRSFTRHRKSLIDDSGRYLLRMQKAMELMNIKLHSVISDIMGKSGRAIVEAIIGGERDANNFLGHVDARVKASPETIRKSLVGNWREEHLFALAENYEMYKFAHEKIRHCEVKIEQCLQEMAAINNEGVIESVAPENNQVAPVEGQVATEMPMSKGKAKKKMTKPKKKTKNQPRFDTWAYLNNIHGVDVTAIYGINEGAALDVLAETGTDLSKFESEDCFVAWLNLCPNNKVSGGKLISSRVMKRKAGRATQAFRAAANAIQRSNNWLGDYFRRMKAKGGNKYAIIATARKLAIIYYKMVTEKKEFCPLDVTEYRTKYKEQKIERLEKQLAKLKSAA